MPAGDYEPHQLTSTQRVVYGPGFKVRGWGPSSRADSCSCRSCSRAPFSRCRFAAAAPKQAQQLQQQLSEPN